MGDLHLKQVEARSGTLRCQFTGSRSCLGPCGEPFDDFMAAEIVAQTIAANRRPRPRRPEGGAASERSCVARCRPLAPSTSVAPHADSRSAAEQAERQQAAPWRIGRKFIAASPLPNFLRPPLRMRAKCGVDTCWPKKKPPGNRWGAFEGREVRWFRPFRAAVAAKWSRV